MSDPTPDDRAESAHDTLAGEVERVIYQDEESGFAVVVLKTATDTQTAAGELAPVAEGEFLRLHGRWQVHARYGQQFRAQWSERSSPTTLEGLRRYLGGGAFEGVGPDLADRVVAHFGEDTLEALEAGETRLQEVAGIGPKRAAALATVFREGHERHRVLAELRGLGLNSRQTRDLYERWQAGAIGRLRKDPYALLGELHGFGFATAERIAVAVGIARDSEVRARGLLRHRLREAAREGHVCLPAGPLIETLSSLGLARERVEAAVQALREDRGLVIESDESGEWLYLSGLWADECGVAEHIRRLQHTASLEAAADHASVMNGMRRAGFQPDSDQRAALEMALREPVGVLTGGPGTGKTSVLRLLLDILEAAASSPICLASPTGRAAKRLEEATGRKATTLHRLLGWDPRLGSFHHDEDEPLEAAFLVVDEVSMMDLPLAHALLRAIPDGCRLLLVGDADQLPSVGPGRVLADLVAAGGVPTAQLNQVHRQSEGSSIVTAAHDLLRGRVPRGEAHGSLGQFFVVEPQSAHAAAEMIERLVCERIPERYGFDPRDEVLVLSPMYRGPMGVDALNERLAAKLNPDGQGPDWAKPLRVGDRVMVIRNDYEREVFNGDTGRVVEFGNKHLVVLIGERLHSYTSAQLSDLVPAYCVTVHRAQGCEARAAVLAVGWSHFLLLRRNLVYTGLTRAKELGVIVAEPGALRKAVASTDDQRRFGRLLERLPAAGEAIS